MFSTVLNGEERLEGSTNGAGGPQTRATDLEGHSGDRVCRCCGHRIGGRRRNGYCSDRCRMQERRDEARRRRLELLDAIEAAVQELRQER
jgi:hypothetical protein